MVNSDLKPWKDTDKAPSEPAAQPWIHISCTPSLLQPCLEPGRNRGARFFLYPEASSSPATNPEGLWCCQTSQLLKASLETKQLLRILKIAGQSLLKQLGGRQRQWHLLQGISLTQKAERKQIVFPLNGPKPLRTTEFNPCTRFLLSLGIMFERGKKNSNWSMCTADLQNVLGKLGCLKRPLEN